MNKKLILGILLLIVAAAAVCFYPSLKNGFTNWDDDEYLTENPAVRQLSWTNIGRIFTTFTTSVYAPLAVLTYSVEYRFVKLAPFHYHLDNLILHLANCALVFFLILMLARDVRIAGVAALLFAIHPLRVESVAWITERKDVLAVFFGLASMTAYVRHARDRTNAGYIIALALYPLSLLAKPMALTFPVLFILIDWFLGRKIDRGSGLEKIPFLAVALALAAVNFRAQGTALHSAADYVRHVFLGGYCLLFYGVKITLPINLSALYPYPYHTGQPLPALYYAAPLGAAAVAAVGWYFGRKDRRIAFGLLFFLIAIMPVSQFIPLAGPALVADRYAYFPGIGIGYLAGVGYAALIGGKRGLSPFLKTLFPAAAMLIFIGLGFATMKRCAVWKNEIRLWDDVIRKHPGIAIAYDNRGIGLTRVGQYEPAITDFNRALVINPTSFKIYNNRGLAYFLNGDFERSLRDFSEALRINPRYPDALNNRGIVYCRLGDNERAVLDFSAALDLKPDYGNAYLNRGTSYAVLGRTEEALRDLTRAIELYPRPAEAYAKRGNVYRNRNEPGPAIADFDAAIRIEPGYAEAYNSRGIVFAERGEGKPALNDFNRALEIWPGYADALNNRGNVFRGRGELDRALADFSRAVRVAPDFADAYYNRAVIYFLMKDYAAAAADLKKYEILGGKVSPDFYRDLRRTLPDRPLN